MIRGRAGANQPEAPRVRAPAAAPRRPGGRKHPSRPGADADGLRADLTPSGRGRMPRRGRPRLAHASPPGTDAPRPPRAGALTQGGTAMATHLRVFPVGQEEETFDGQEPTVHVRVGDLLPLLAMAARHNY